MFEKDITGWLQKEYGAIFAQDTDLNMSLDESNADLQLHEEPAVALNPLMGIASGAFENYMRPYITLEEQSLTDLLKEALEDRTVDTRGERPVFISSTNLFVFIKGSITRCTALTRGKAFFLLYKAFKDALRKYALVLDRKLPAPMAAQSPGVGLSLGGTFSKTDNATAAHYRIPPGEEVTVCHVISTCEYCADTLEALEELIRDTIDGEYKSKIDMMSDQEGYHDITAKSIRVLVSGLTRRVEDGLKPMLSQNWAAGAGGGMDSAGQESPYVLTMHREIEPFVIQVRNLLPTSYFRSFCDKFASNFIVTYNFHITRLKHISESGSQQLLLDVYNLKNLFQKLPVLEEPAPPGLPGKKSLPTGSTIAPAMYSKMINKQFTRLETLIKLVGTPENLLVDNFKAQWSDGTTQDFVLVLNLKGYNRSQQAGMLEKFGLDSAEALKGATAGVTSASIVQERLQGLQDQGSTVARDLYQMRQKVDVFRKTFRSNSSGG